LARYWHFTAFTEFDGFYLQNFFCGTLIFLKSTALPLSYTPNH
jgi:hypothetical protein